MSGPQQQFISIEVDNIEDLHCRYTVFDTGDWNEPTELSICIFASEADLEEEDEAVFSV